MRLSLSVSDRHIVRASLRAKGWLGAHVSLSDGIDSDEPSNRVWLAATDASDTPNSVHSVWEGVSLSVGDKIEIEILPDGESDPRTTLTQTSESPSNLFSDIEHARALLAAIQICDQALMGAVNRARDEPPDELQKSGQRSERS